MTLLVAAAALAVACSSARGRPPNIVLLSIDTLRADHLGCYGYTRGTSPNIDRLAQRSTLYEEVRAPTPWTLPSHAAMLSGMHPLRLGILSENGVIPKRAPLVAETLSRAGYQTAAFVDSGAGGFVGERRGFGRGFATFKHAPFEPHGPYKYDAPATVRAAEGWLRARDAAKPFFLFLHTKSVHSTPQNSDTVSDLPYDKPRRYLERFLPGGQARFPWRSHAGARGARFLLDLNQRIARGVAGSPALPAAQLEELIALYDAGIFYVDEQVGVLVDVLRRHGLDRDTIFIVTADHGEAFLEHRFVLHWEVYEPLLRVPLLVYDPRDPRGRRVRAAVQLEDLAATLLAQAGLRADQALDGRVLPASDAAAAGRRPSLAFSSACAGGAYEAYALRRGDFKLVHHRLAGGAFFDELFDLARDPSERRALPAEGEVARSMLAEIEAGRRGAGAPDLLQPGDDTIEELRALGYTQ